MPIIPKTTRKATKAAKSSKGTAQIEKEQRKERRMIADMMERERVMKWLLIGVIILLLLLLLFAGYATDWLKGLNKDAVSNPPASSLDASTTPNNAGSASTTAGTSTTGTKSNTTSDTSKGTTSTTTTNNSSTTNTTTPSPSLLDDLSTFYTNTGVGDNISTITQDASQLGLTKTCHTQILIQVCDFTNGALTVTTNNLLGSGVVTSVTKNF